MSDPAPPVLLRPVTWVAAILVSSVPALANLAVLARQPVMNRLDYWTVVNDVIGPGGGLAFDHVLRYQNEHPMAVPALLYWANFRLTRGYAWSLGVIVFAVVAMTVGLLVRTTTRGSRQWWLAPAMTVLLSWVLFTPRGARNLAIPMSGAAWCVANLFSTIAIVFAIRRRPWWAMAFCAAASLSYGTGLGSWFAVAVVFLWYYLRGERDHKGLVPVVVPAVAGVLVIGFVLATIPPHAARSGHGLQLVGRVENVLAVAGAIVGSPDVGVVIGAVALLAILGGITTLLAGAWTDRTMIGRSAPDGSMIDGLSDETVPLALGLGVLSIVMCALLGLGRSGNEEWGQSSRYASVTAFTVISAILLAYAAYNAAGHPVRVRVPLGVMTVAAMVSFATAQPALNSVSDEKFDASVLALEMKLGHVQTVVDRPDTDLMRRVGHVPFNGDPIGDCGLLGESIDPASIPTTIIGNVDSLVLAGPEALTAVEGWIGEGPRWDCVGIVDPTSGEVIGAGLIGEIRPDVEASGVPTVGSSFTARVPGGHDTEDLVMVAVGSEHSPSAMAVVGVRLVEPESS